MLLGFTFMYGVVGVGALLSIFAAFVLGPKLAARRDGGRSGLRFGAVAGLILSPILTFLVAGYMTNPGSPHQFFAKNWKIVVFKQ